MKKRVLKKWVENFLIIILILSILILVGECNNIIIFIGSKFVALIFGIISGNILYKYGRWNVEKE